jgi:hypothetical protein
MNDSTTRFALCIDPSGAEDIEKEKVYQVLQDGSAEKEGLLRVIDESTEDYLCPSTCFAFLDLPHRAREALSARV